MLGCIFLGLLMAQSSLAQDSESSASFMINRPTKLAVMYPDPGISLVSANFGTPAYGHGAAITGTLVYAPPGDRDGCNAFDKAGAPGWPTNAGQPVVVILDRGGNCSFVQKVRNAQKAGAMACVVVDNTGEANLPLMADDGTGGDINIPSVLIHQADGAAIKQFVSELVMVTLMWNLPHPDNRVEWDFWTSSDDETSKNFKQQFRKVTKVLDIHSEMAPHYFFMSGAYSECLEAANGTLPCGKQCTNSGRYCAVDPEQDISTGLDGSHVVRENLRRMCIWKNKNATDGNVAANLLWFDYVNEFEKGCRAADQWSAECSERNLQKVGGDAAAMHACITRSGGFEHAGGGNSMMDAELQLREDKGIFFVPTIAVNGVAYRGSLSCPSPISPASCGVLSSICAGYVDGSEPAGCDITTCELGQTRDGCGVCGGNGAVDICGKCLPKDNPVFNKTCLGCDGVANSGMTTDECGQCNFPYGNPDRKALSCAAAQGQSGTPLWMVIVIVLVVVLAVGLGVYWFMRRREEAMREDIDSLLQQYLPMDNTALLPTDHSLN